MGFNHILLEVKAEWMSLCREQPTVFKILVGEIPTAKLQGERQH